MTLFKNKYRIETSRLRGWDYTAAGYYFVTICTREQLRFFGEVVNGEIHLSPIGEIACDYWQGIPEHTSGNVELDAFIIMPNHVHGIIVIRDRVETLHKAGVETLHKAGVETLHGAGVETLHKAGVETLHKAGVETLHATSLQQPREIDHPMSQISPQPGSLSAVIRSYKSALSRWCGQNNYGEFAWQSRFYDHIIRDEHTLRKIRQYISDNPMKWDIDRNDAANLWM